jgi:hypothetical protein
MMRFAIPLVTVFACSKASAPEAKPAEVRPVSSDGAAVAVALPDAQAQDAAATVHEPGTGLAATTSDENNGITAHPGDDLNTMVASGHGSASPVGRSYVVVTSKRATQGDVGPVFLGFIRVGQASVKSCYEEVRKHDATAAGNVTLNFSVTPGGAVVDPNVTSWSDDLTKCVTSAAAGWKIPKITTKTSVELVLELSHDQ